MSEGEQGHQARVAEQHRRLALVRAGFEPPAPEPYELEDSVGTAEGVRAVARNRRVFSIEIDHAVLGQTPGAAAELLREAVNAALAQALVDLPAAGDPGPDLAALGQQLADFTRQGGETLRRIQGLLEASMARTGIHGDSTPQYVDYLFEDALAVVSSTQAALAADPAPLVTGEGSDEAEEVTAAVANGQVHALSLTLVAMTYTPAELAQAVLEAVNTAMDEWEAQASATDRPALDVAALQEISQRAPSSPTRASSTPSARSCAPRSAQQETSSRSTSAPTAA